MRLISTMADKVRKRIRSFLQIEEAQSSNIYIQETLDFESNAIKNRIWYLGDSKELSQLYQSINCDVERFWKAAPTPGYEIRKIHTGLPGMIIDILTSIVVADMNKIKLDDASKQIDWENIAKDNHFDKLTEEIIRESLIVGDGAIKFTINTNISQYPMMEFVSGENIDIKYNHGRVTEIIFKTVYTHKYKKYVLEEAYGKNYIISKLYDGEREIPLNTIPDTEYLPSKVEFDGNFIMAVPFMVFNSSRWKGRGKSIYDAKCDSFDALDEAWSQWMEALRKGRTKEYIPDSLCPRNPHTGEILRPRAFDNQYFKVEGNMTEEGKDEIKVVQPTIPHESYLATYIAALDLCLQGLISPSTLGIDVKKLDNAEAQREKEKATLYTRNKIVGAIQNIFPEIVNIAIKVYETLLKQPITEQKADIPFGEYANPSFESQVETVSKAKSGGIMSIEAAVDELYGDSKDGEWKAEEVLRLKAEQGIVEMEEPQTADDVIDFIEDDTEEKKTGSSMLNGAQVGSLMNIIKMVKTSQLTRSEAINIVTATLGVPKESAETFIEENL